MIRFIGFISGFFVFITSTISASAYKRTVSPQGKNLFWKTTPISYIIHRDVPAGLDVDQVYETIRTSFRTWTLPDCTCVRFVDSGLTTDTQLGYDQTKPESNKNIIIFQSTQWRHDPRAVAITSNVFNEDTGEVVAYDMELNNVHFVFSLDGQPRDGKATMDLQNVVTHEVGHIIGLDHSPERDSTMFVSGLPGEIKKRDLHSDDLQGLCDLYPKISGCMLTANNQLPLDAKGCGCTSSASPLISWTVLLFAFLVWLLGAVGRMLAKFQLQKNS